jgi:hypothetical protein
MITYARLRDRAFCTSLQSIQEHSTDKDAFGVLTCLDCCCRTHAQKKHEEYLAKRETERLSKAAAKSHRERVQEYNDKLSQLSEHHDIPKVGPG